MARHDRQIRTETTEQLLDVVTTLRNSSTETPDDSYRELVGVSRQLARIAEDIEFDASCRTGGMACVEQRQERGRIAESGIKIAVLDRGWVFVGHVTVDGDACTIERAMCVRKWGTTNGLGELRNGPLEGTKLDPAGRVVAPARALLFTIDVEADQWAQTLNS